MLLLLNETFPWLLLSVFIMLFVFHSPFESLIRVLPSSLFFPTAVVFHSFQVKKQTMIVFDHVLILEASTSHQTQVLSFL